MSVELVDGDLLDVDAEAIVNPWNRNTIPWWLLLPQGVSGAIKRRGGAAIFKELRRYGRLALGQGVVTSAGSLPYSGIIHVAGINDLWRASETSIRKSVRSSVHAAEVRGWKTIAMPLIGAGSGGFNSERAQSIIESELKSIGSSVRVKLVRFRKA